MSSFIRLHTVASGDAKCFILLFILYTVILPNTWKHTLMWKTGGIPFKILIKCVVIQKNHIYLHYFVLISTMV